MPSTKLRLQAKPEDFLDWLEDHTKHHWWRRLPVDHQHGEVHSVADDRNMERVVDFTIFVMDCTGEDGLGNKYASRPGLIHSPMSVKIQPGVEGEIDVTLVCHRPIGYSGYHAELVEAIKDQYPDAHPPPARKEDGPSTLETGTKTDVGTTPSWLPKTAETRKVWKEAYRELMDQKEEWADPGDPPPTKKDQRTRLQYAIGKSWGDDTIRNILKAGRRGLL